MLMAVVMRVLVRVGVLDAIKAFIPTAAPQHRPPGKCAGGNAASSACSLFSCYDAGIAWRAWPAI